MCPMTLQINKFNVVRLFLFEPVETLVIFFPPVFFANIHNLQDGRGRGRLSLSLSTTSTYFTNT